MMYNRFFGVFLREVISDQNNLLVLFCKESAPELNMI
jgi:hypothetical protein